MGKPKAEELSIQKRAAPLTVQDGGVSGIWWFTSSSADEIDPWWSQQRDRQLREFWMKPGNDILAGAVSSMVKKFTAMNWVVEGPQRVTNWAQKLLAEAEFGAGWSELLRKVLTDYNTQDRGSFIEIIGAGDPDKPLQGLPVGLAHLDAQFCQLTGDLTYPVIFMNPKDGRGHRIHASRIAHMVDMPSPNETMMGVGFCSVSRVLAASQVLLKVTQYENEKLSDLPQAGLLMFNNVAPKQFDDVKADYERERRKLGQELWTNVMVMFGLDPAQPATANFISFANLPDGFDKQATISLYVNIVALAFGVDVREFWPMSAGPLGTATESLIQHQKARGKGVGEVISQLERTINWKILPASCTFHLDFIDDEEDTQRAQLLQLKSSTIMGMWTGGQDPAGGQPIVSRDEVRQMLADNIPYFNEKFLENDITEEEAETDIEQANPKEESANLEEQGTDIEQEVKALYGPTVKVRRDGKMVRTAVAKKAQGKKTSKEKGGAGSGNWGHAGREGEIGGSLPNDMALSRTTGRDRVERQQAAREGRSLTSGPGTPIGTPVSDGLDLSKLPGPKSALGSAVRDTIDTIGRVHGDGNLSRIPVTPSSGKQTLGQYSHQYYGDKPLGISVSRYGDSGLSFAHEVGHFLDHQGLSTRGIWASSSDPDLEEWRSAVKGSRAIKTLLDALETGKVSGVTSHGYAVEKSISISWTRYALRTNEIFARSYAQYIATRGGGEPGKEFKAWQEKNNLIPEYWADDDFEPIGRALDDLFKKKGWTE